MEPAGFGEMRWVGFAGWHRRSVLSGRQAARLLSPQPTVRRTQLACGWRRSRFAGPTSLAGVTTRIGRRTEGRAAIHALHRVFFSPRRNVGRPGGTQLGDCELKMRMLRYTGQGCWTAPDVNDLGDRWWRVREKIRCRRRPVATAVPFADCSRRTARVSGASSRVRSPLAFGGCYPWTT